MKLGTVVIPKPGYYLRSGAEAYSSAVVCSEDPFMLVSTAGDMLWNTTVAEENFEPVCMGSPELINHCMHRIEPRFRVVMNVGDSLLTNKLGCGLTLLKTAKISVAADLRKSSDAYGWIYWNKEVEYWQPVYQMNTESLVAAIVQAEKCIVFDENERAIRTQVIFGRRESDNVIHLHSLPVRPDLPKGFVPITEALDLVADIGEQSVTYGFLYRLNASSVWTIDREMTPAEVKHAKHCREHGLILNRKQQRQP